MNDPLSGNLLALPCDRWKIIRAKLTRTFTSAQLRAMFSTFLDCGVNLQNHLDKFADKRELLDVREITGNFSTNIISSVAFGYDIDSFNEPNNPFRVFARDAFEPNLRTLLLTYGFFIFPKFMQFLRLKLMNKANENFIRWMVKENLEYREKNNIVRKDLFQLLIELRNNGMLPNDDQSNTMATTNESQKTITEIEIAANSFIFFFAGFESTSSTITFSLYEMAKNPEIQRRAHEEIDRVLEEHSGQITYKSISEMKYLEQCINGDCLFVIFHIICKLN